MTTKTTIHLTLPTLPRPHLDQLPAPVAIAVVIFCLLGIVGAIGRIAGAPSAAAVPTARLPEPIIIIATPQALAVPLIEPAQQIAAAPAGNVTRRAIVVYGAADLASAIGAVEPGRAFTPVAHYGADWMIVDMADSGRVFVRVADLYDLPPNLIDLKPAPAPQVIIQPVYVNAPERLEAPAAPILAPAVEQPYQVVNQPPEAPQAQPAPTIAPVQPTAVPAPAPAGNLGHDTSVEAEWAREQWRQEHCIGDTCWP